MSDCASQHTGPIFSFVLEFLWADDMYRAYSTIYDRSILRESICDAMPIGRIYARQRVIVTLVRSARASRRVSLEWVTRIEVVVGGGCVRIRIVYMHSQMIKPSFFVRCG